MDYSELPYELIIDVGLDLSPRDLLNLCQTSTSMNALCLDDKFWRRKYFKDYGAMEDTGKTWRENYIDKYNMNIMEARAREKIPCSGCGKIFSRGTLERRGGVCAWCANRMKK